MVFHDSDFMKLAGVDREIWDVTLADLQGIDIGGRFGPSSRASVYPRWPRCWTNAGAKSGW